MDINSTVNDINSISPLITAISPLITMLGTLAGVYLGYILSEKSENRKKKEQEFSNCLKSYRRFAEVFALTSSNIFDLWDAAIEVGASANHIQYGSNDKKKSINDLVNDIENLMLSESGINKEKVEELRVSTARNLIPVLREDIIKMRNKIV
jgi:hypothetical protein